MSEARISVKVDGAKVAADAFAGIQKAVQQTGDAAAGANTKFDTFGRGLMKTGDMARAATDGIGKTGHSFAAVGESARRAAAEISRVAPTTSSLTGAFGMASTAAGAFGITLGVGAVAGAAIAFGRSVLADADALTKLSDKTGVGIVGLQRLRVAGDDAGVGLESMTGAINQMQNRLAGGDASAIGAVKRLGLSLGDIQQMEPDQQFMAIADALRAVKNPADQVNTAMDLFGRGGAEVLPVVKRGFDDVRNASVGMSEEAVRTLDAAGDAMAKLSRQGLALAGEGLAAVVGSMWDFLEITRQLERVPPKFIDPKQQAAFEKFQATMKQVQAEAPKAVSEFGNLGMKLTFVGDAALKLSGGLFAQAPLSKEAAAAAKKHADELRRQHEEFVKNVDAARKLESGFAGLQATVGLLTTTDQELVRQLVEMRAVIDAIEKSAWLASFGFAGMADGLEKIGKQSTELDDLRARLRLVHDIEKVMPDGFYQTGLALESLGQKSTEIDELRIKLGASSTPLTDLTRHFVELGQIAGGNLDAITRNMGLFVANVERMARTSGGLRTELKALGRQWQELEGIEQAAIATMAALSIAAAATDPKTRAGQTLGYASKGAQIGNSIVPGYGALVGAGAGALVGALKVPPNEIEARAKYAEWQQVIITQFAKMATGAQRMEAGSEGWRKINVAVRDEYRRIGLSGEQAMQDISTALDSTHHSAADVDAALGRINANLEKAARVAALASSKGLTGLDLVDTAGRMTAINDEAGTLYDQFQSLIVAGYKESSVLTGLSTDMNKFVVDAVAAGQGIPHGMQPILESLITTGQLTNEAARALQGLGPDVTPSFQELSGAASRLGLTIEDLGNAGRQIRLNDAASSAAAAFETLKWAGVDTSGIFTRMGDEAKAGFQSMATEALTAGLTIPENMKPIFEGLARTGELTDEFGNELSDVSRFNFAKPLEKMVEDLIKALDRLVDKFGDVQDAANISVSTPVVGGGPITSGGSSIFEAAARTSLARAASSPATIGATRSSGGSVTIEIPVKLDGREVTRVVARLLPSELRKMGAL